MKAEQGSVIAFDIASALATIRARTDVTPDIALVLGSGLGGLADRIDGVRIPYGAVPGLAPSSVHTHAGEFVVGTLAGRNVIAMSGRLHMYEGHSAEAVTRPVRVMAALMETGMETGRKTEMGARTLVVTNAAGALREDLRAGDIVAIEDHLSLVNLAGGDPLRGNVEGGSSEGGNAEERFVSMNGAYAPELVTLAQVCGARQGVGVARGVYAHVVGPTFETPAEVRMLRGLGGDMVGMSTVPEVVVARSLGMNVLALSAISNVCIGELDGGQTTAGDAWAALEAAAPKMAALVESVVEAVVARIK